MGSKYDPEVHLERPESATAWHFYGYNVLGFRDN